MLWRMNCKQVCRVSELSGESGISPSTITGILDRLVDKGWLERVPDPDDRRGILMKITPEASVLMQRMMTMLNEDLETVLNVLPEGRLQELLEDIQMILDYLEHDKR